jgi:phage-related protein
MIPLERLLKLGKFTLALTAFDPFAYSIQNAGDSQLDSNLILDSDIHLDPNEYSFTVASQRTISVNNYGTMNVSPITNITGSFSTLTISANGKTFSFSEAMSSNTLTIDHDKMTAKQGSDNKLSFVTGDFLTLIPGDNSITISGTGLNCTIDFVFAPKFI